MIEDPRAPLDNPMHSVRVVDPRDYDMEYRELLELADRELEYQREEALLARDFPGIVAIPRIEVIEPIPGSQENPNDESESQTERL